MPYISTTTNMKLSDAQRNSLKQRMGEAIALIPGKSEEWLMLSWHDETPMAFRGLTDPCAICEVKVFGHSEADAYDQLTAALCRMLQEEAGLSPDRIYVTIQELDTWGYDGGIF